MGEVLISKKQSLQSIDTLLSILQHGCSGCSFDEAEGELMDHCSECRETVTTLAYELLIRKRMVLGSNDELLAEIRRLHTILRKAGVIGAPGPTGEWLPDETIAPQPLEWHTTDEGWWACDYCDQEVIEVLKCCGCGATTIARPAAKS